MVWQQEDERSLPTEWEKSPPGQVSGLRQKLRARRKRRVFLRAAAGAAAALFVTGGGLGLWWLSAANRVYDFGGITCSEVMQLVEAYQAGTLNDADRERIRQHLARCPRCGPHFRQMGEMGPTRRLQQPGLS